MLMKHNHVLYYIVLLILRMDQIISYIRQTNINDNECIWVYNVSWRQLARFVKALVNCQLHNNQRWNLMVRRQLVSAPHATAKEKLIKRIVIIEKTWYDGMQSHGCSRKKWNSLFHFYLSSQDHQAAAIGMSPYIFILASEPFFFIWSWNVSTIFSVAAFLFLCEKLGANSIWKIFCIKLRLKNTS